jgi:hypothetical protein
MQENTTHRQAPGLKLQEEDTFGISDINLIFNKRVTSSHPNTRVHDCPPAQ